MVSNTKTDLKNSINVIIQQQEITTNAKQQALTTAKQTLINSGISQELVDQSVAPIYDFITKSAEAVSEWKEIVSDLSKT